MSSDSDVYPDIGKVGMIMFAQEADGTVIPVLLDSEGNLKVNASVTIPEVTIGDIVIKDGTTTAELKVNTDGSLNIAENVVKAAFTESDLETGVYTVSATMPKANMGFGINNNSDANELTFTIGALDISVPAGKSFYGVFVKDTTIAVTGTSLNFDAFVEG
jgi:hypothetical protein